MAKQLNIRQKARKFDSKFYHEVLADECHSSLEVPDGRNPMQNAWLTITINYSLDFIDRRNLGGKAYLKNNKAYVKDSDGVEFALSDWDSQSQTNFNKKFAKGESFWNYKFLLITPADYDALDFTSMAGQGFVCRPNVICLFRLKPGGTPTHLSIKVVRPDLSFWDNVLGRSYRSDEFNYKIEDADTKTLWHELGHALDQDHVMALKGDARCMVDINADRCYEGPNIMGRGSQLETINARAWSELIYQHTENRQQWVVSQAVNTPPRRIPLGVANLGKPTSF